jgi:hypothetical protein
MATKRTKPKTPTKACTHPTKRIISGGLMRCEVCKAIRGVDRVWRLDGKPCGS